MSAPDIIYKVTALYLLNKSQEPLPTAAICEFFVNGNYTDYFNIVSIISSLGESKLIDTNSTNNVTMHSINQAGQDTLAAMMDRISPKVKSEVEEFLSKNHIKLKAARELVSNYDKATYGGYTIHLRANEENVPVIDLNLHVGNETVAKKICTNWKKNYEALYETLMENLI